MRPPEAPIVAFEGGPGYGSIGSNAAYRFLFEPLLRDRDLILMDQRGTGASSTIDCPALQKGIGNYTRAVAACAEQLGDAANAYGSAAAADDLAAILAALEVPSVVVYGDSYGTYLAQVFAIRHPELTDAVVLDAAYDDSFDPFARDAAAALQRAWGTLCRRAGSCRGFPADVAETARRLDRRPLVGTGVDSSGTAYRVRLTGARLAQLMYDATYTFTIYRDLPAALEAYESGDPAPLLRLAAEDSFVYGGGGDPRYYSEGAYAAIACHDYPTIWDRSASAAERRRQLEAAVDGLAPDAFAPFPNDVFLRMLWEDQLVDGCLRWPALGPGDSPMPTTGPHSDVPVLVLDGELDITTPLVNASDAAAAWPNATLVPVANEIHISALYDYERCASRIVRRFVRTFDAGDTSCASRTPRINVVESFPAEVADAPQARSAGPHDRSTARDRRVAWAAVETVADAFNRWWNELFGGTGVGLRGRLVRDARPVLPLGPSPRVDLRRDTVRVRRGDLGQGRLASSRRDGDRPPARRGSGRLRHAPRRVRDGSGGRRDHRARDARRAACRGGDAAGLDVLRIVSEGRWSRPGRRFGIDRRARSCPPATPTAPSCCSSPTATPPCARSRRAGERRHPVHLVRRRGRPH